MINHGKPERDREPEQDVCASTVFLALCLYAIPVLVFIWAIHHFTP
jgi:hypothetical protein